MRWDQAYRIAHFPFPRAQSVSTWKREHMSPLFVTTLQASLEVLPVGASQLCCWVLEIDFPRGCSAVPLHRQIAQASHTPVCLQISFVSNHAYLIRWTRWGKVNRNKQCGATWDSIFRKENVTIVGLVTRNSLWSSTGLLSAGSRMLRQISGGYIVSFFLFTCGHVLGRLKQNDLSEWRTFF